MGLASPLFISLLSSPPSPCLGLVHGVVCLDGLKRNTRKSTCAMYVLRAVALRAARNHNFAGAGLWQLVSWLV